MLYSDYLALVSETNADISPYIQHALEDDHFRMLLVKELLTNKKINVYYHTYVLLSEVSKANGQVLLPYLTAFISLLGHDNSYHRNYGMHLISLMASYIDTQSLKILLPKYYKCLYDEKISTRKYCIVYSKDLIKTHGDLGHDIVSYIRESLWNTRLPYKHKWLLIKTFMTLIEELKLDLNEETILFFSDIIDRCENEKHKKQIISFMKTTYTIN